MTRMAGQAVGRKITDFMGTKADYGGIGMTATKDFAETNANVAINNARTADARMSSEAKVAAAGHWADATKAAGQAQGQASMVGGIASGIGGLAGGIGKGGGLFGGGSMPGASSIGSAATSPFDFSPYSSGVNMAGATSIGTGTSFGSTY